MSSVKQMEVPLSHRALARANATAGRRIKGESNIHTQVCEEEDEEEEEEPSEE